MKKILISAFFAFSHFLHGQLDANKDFSTEVTSKFQKSKYYSPEEIISQLGKHDYSKILLTKHHDKVLGYIGVNFRRIEIRFISIIKNSDNPTEYFVYGKSRVGTNIVDFQGKLALIAARKNATQDFEDKITGGVLGKYVFYENPNQKHVGIFKGSFTSSWILDKETQELSYNDSYLMADGFSNNKFVGTWTPYNSNDFKTCNWGEYRIPYSSNYELGKGGLDSGAGEFSPIEKFDKYGWESYLTTGEIYLNKIEVKEDLWWKN